MKALVRTAAFALLAAPAAYAADPPRKKSDVTVDVTETGVLAQRFAARTDEGERAIDQGYGVFLNRLNGALRYKRLTLGARLDSAIYWARPIDRDRADIPVTELPVLESDSASRYRDSLYLAKVWTTYAAPGLEVTAGDAYAQMGRGLILSLRKVDELGIDTTVRGAKVAWTAEPVSLMVLGGILNPTRVDEASGRALFLPRSMSFRPNPNAVYGSDRVVAAEVQAGRGLPLALTTHFAHFTRCAPFAYGPNGQVLTGLFDAPFGSCAENDKATWLSTLPNTNPTLSASSVTMAGQGLEIPELTKHAKLYITAALQRRHRDANPNEPLSEGNAVYGSLTTTFGPVTNTLEVKSYRNFYPVSGAVNLTEAPEFNSVIYSSPPTAEVITQDSMLGFFNACVNGGRLRTDVRVSDKLLLYGSGVYAYTKTESDAGRCDGSGSQKSSLPRDTVDANVYDGLGGLEWHFEGNKSHLFASGGYRHNDKVSGELVYREGYVQYTFVKHIKGPYSIELQGRHRLRRQENQNVHDVDPEWWREGENYTAFKVAPKWVLSQGFEYVTRIGFPTYYWNGGILFKFTSESNVRVLVGQQRGGLRCVSGFCKFFPAFEGARAEVTVRF